MDWRLEYGEHQAGLEAASKRAGKQLGKPMPVLFPDLHRYWQAFFRLSASRRSGYDGAEPLQPADVLAFLDIHGIVCVEERGRYDDFITVLDTTFLNWRRRKRAEVKAANGDT